MDAASVTSSGAEEHPRTTTCPPSSTSGAGKKGGGGGGQQHSTQGDDLRNYAYEGDSSSPGSLSSCKFEALRVRECVNARKLDGISEEVYAH